MTEQYTDDQIAEEAERIKNDPVALSLMHRLVAGDKDMTPTEFAKWAGRPVPEWFNLDVLIEPDEVAEIEAIRVEVYSFVREAIVLGERVRWALSLSNRFDCQLDDSVNIFTDAVGTDDFNISDVLKRLFEGGRIDDDELVSVEKDFGDPLPELVEALHKIRREDIFGAPERGSFEVPRKSEVAR
jgi:hypothetical protein